MQDNEIIESVLINLQGYVLTESVNQSELNDLEYDKKVSSNEVLAFYRTTTSYVLSYLNRTELPTKIVGELKVTDPIVLDAVAMWTAGRLWNKYNVRVNNNEDDTTPFGYGDKLVIQAKEILKPYKYFNMKVY